MSWSDESLAWLDGELDAARLGELKLNLLRGDLLLPALVLKDAALSHNATLMADYCRRHKVDIAPHIKVTMSPAIAQRQVEAGAWALTVATISQAAVLRAHGFSRIMLANELVEARAAKWVADQLADPEFEFLCWVDSIRGVELLDRYLAEAGAVRRIGVLVEYGPPGCRAGCRTIDEAVDVAIAVGRSSSLELRGVAGYEATAERGKPVDPFAAAQDFIIGIRRVAEALAQSGLFVGLDEVVISAGGSTYFDTVVDVLPKAEVGLPVRAVLRSGAYITHDAAENHQHSPLGERGKPARRLEQAAEVWGVVLSRPEPTLAIVGFGKRDAPHCSGLPVVQSHSRDGVVTTADSAVRLIWMNDQHSFLQLEAETDLLVGDLIGCGVYYPCCPGLQKWRNIPLVDDDYTVLDVLRAYP